METCSRWVRQEWMANYSTNFTKSSAASDVFIVFFTFLACFWLQLQKWFSLQSDPCSHCMLAPVQLWNILPRPLQTFVQLEQCVSYRESRWILSRRQHAPNKQYVLNNDVRLITWFYGMWLEVSIPPAFPALQYSYACLLSMKLHKLYKTKCESKARGLTWVTTLHTCLIHPAFQVMQITKFL